MIETITYADGAVRLLDQTRLPTEVVVHDCRTAAELAEAIRTMRVRGAPALGIAAAYALALGAREYPGEDPAAFRAHLERVAAEVRATRPTAVNLFWAVARALAVADAALPQGVAAAREALLQLAHRLREEDVAINRQMGAHGAALVPDGARVLTHCNAGALATGGYGTALGVIRGAVEAGKRLHVYVDETRPFLQGARLTAWELHADGIPLTLITDNMAGYFMAQGKVDLVIVGADRIAANGDVANKIGTYSLAVLAQAHGIPFYVAAPLSTVDLGLPDGAAIPIEERAPTEVTHLAGQRIAPEGIAVANPAFDVTPARYVTAIITERGILRPPYEAALRTALATADDSGVERPASEEPPASGARAR
ncbi:MAG: S-methyl-5-thioribose-1-phosphate isomerase [Chloroflexi bacterium]|nr:S-methyl-5-thioribose-1-phosphate isomerase [Chloroflexota bacterium]